MSKFDRALASLHSVRQKDDTERFHRFSLLMKAACERAAKWNPDLDPNERLRRADQSFLDAGAVSIVASLSKLIKLSQEHSNGFDDVAARCIAEVSNSSNLLRIPSERLHGRLPGEFMRNILISMREHFETELDPVKRRVIKAERIGGEHRHVSGALFYTKKVDLARRPDPKTTSLLFELAFYVRRYTAGLPSRAIMTDDVMPACGRPHYDLLSEFTSAGVGHSFTDNGAAFKKALKSNAGKDPTSIKWWGWGKPEGGRSRRRMTSYWATTDD